MKEDLYARLSRRYLALDIHKHYSIVAGVDFDGDVVLEPRRIEHGELEAWLSKRIDPSDYVVIESTTNAWHIYDLLEPLAEKVLVANPIKVKQIAEARVKTDIRDTLILARLLAANLIPAIWVPPAHIRELRYLLSQRRHLIGMHTATVNRMHSVAHRHHLNHPRGKRFIQKNIGWQQSEDLSGSEQFQLELEMNTKQHLYAQAELITEKLRTMSHEAPWADEMMYLMQLPGFGIITGMTVLAAIGDISRFPSFKKLSSYSGLVPGVEQSGTKLRGKRITKQGRKELRWAMVEAAWRAVRMSDYWKSEYEKYLRRLRKPNQAIVVVARKLLVAVWHVLSKEETDIRASEEELAYKMLLLSWSLNENVRKGLSYKEFAKYALMKLGVEEDITRFERRGVPRRLAPKAEVLARMAELELIF